MKNYFKQDGLKDYLLRQEVIDPAAQPIIMYSAPSSMCGTNGDFPAGKLGNMASGFPFEAFGRTWQSSEHLYLLGWWSDIYEHPEKQAMQEDVLTAKNGYVAKVYKKNKYKRFCRPDFVEWRHEWMTFVVWKKCIGNADFRELLLSTGDAMIVEVVKRDPVWAAWFNEDGKLIGSNGMGKILMLCREALRTGVEPQFDIKKWIQEIDVRILDARLLPRYFYDHRQSMCDSKEELAKYCNRPQQVLDIWEVFDTLHPSESIPFPMTENIDRYLFEHCRNLIVFCDDDCWEYELNDAIVTDLEEIASYSEVTFDWEGLRKKMHGSEKSLYVLFYDLNPKQQ